MKKIKTLLLPLLFVGALAGCGGAGGTGTPSSNVGSSISTSQTSQSTEVGEKELAKDLVGICAGKKVYLTTCGQADYAIVGNILKKAGQTGNYDDSNTLLKAADVEDGAVVLLTIGASSKGLGAAGVNAEQEAARAKEFSDAARAGKFSVILFHVGGEARRGTTSDPIITAAFPGSKGCFLVDGANGDGFFNTLSTENSVEVYTVSGVTKLVTYVQQLYAAE